MDVANKIEGAKVFDQREKKKNSRSEKEPSDKRHEESKGRDGATKRKKRSRMNGLSNKLDVCNVCVLQLDVQYSFKMVFVYGLALYLCRYRIHNQ